LKAVNLPEMVLSHSSLDKPRLSSQKLPFVSIKNSLNLLAFPGAKPKMLGSNKLLMGARTIFKGTAKKFSDLLSLVHVLKSLSLDKEIKYRN